MNKWQQQVYDMLRAASRNNLPCTIPADVTHIPANMMLEADRMRWISVKDGLPEDDKTLSFYKSGGLTFTTVLVYVPKIGTELANRLKIDRCGIPTFDEFATDGWVWSSGRNPTHWMPLPEPPKEE